MYNIRNAIALVLLSYYVIVDEKVVFPLLYSLCFYRGRLPIFHFFHPPQYIYSTSTLCLSSQGTHVDPRDVPGKSSCKSMEPWKYFWSIKC